MSSVNHSPTKRRKCSSDDLACSSCQQLPEICACSSSKQVVEFIPESTSYSDESSGDESCSSQDSGEKKQINLYWQKKINKLDWLINQLSKAKASSGGKLSLLNLTSSANEDEDEDYSSDASSQDEPDNLRMHQSEIASNENVKDLLKASEAFFYNEGAVIEPNLSNVIPTFPASPPREPPDSVIYAKRMAQLNGTELAPELATELLDNYMLHINVMFPLITDAQYKLLKSQHPSCAAFLAIIYAMAMKCQNTFFDNTPIVIQDFYRKAKTLVYESLDRPTLVLVQALTLLGIYRYSDAQANSAGIYFNLAVRTAQLLGLHQLSDRPDQLKEQSIEDYQAKKQLWQCIYWLDTIGATAINRPYHISNDYISPPLPSSSFPRELGELAWLKDLTNFGYLWRRMISLIYEKQPQQDLKVYRELVVSFEKWKNGLKPITLSDLSSANSSSLTSDRPLLYLHVISSAFHILLHKPFLLNRESLLSEKEYRDNWHSCTKAAYLITDICCLFTKERMVKGMFTLYCKFQAIGILLNNLFGTLPRPVIEGKDVQKDAETYIAKMLTCLQVDGVARFTPVRQFAESLERVLKQHPSLIRTSDDMPQTPVFKATSPPIPFPLSAKEDPSVKSQSVEGEEWLKIPAPWKEPSFDLDYQKWQSCLEALYQLMLNK